MSTKKITAWIKANPNKLGLVVSAVMAWGSGRGYIQPDTLTMIIVGLSAFGVTVGTVQEVKAARKKAPE